MNDDDDDDDDDDEEEEEEVDDVNDDDAYLLPSLRLTFTALLPFCCLLTQALCAVPFLLVL